MVRNKPKVSIQEISVNFRDVDLAFTSRVLATGNALRRPGSGTYSPGTRFMSRLPSSSAIVSWQDRLERTHFCGKGFSQRQPSVKQTTPTPLPPLPQSDQTRDPQIPRSVVACMGVKHKRLKGLGGLCNSQSPLSRMWLDEPGSGLQVAASELLDSERTFMCHVAQTCQGTC